VSKGGLVPPLVVTLLLTLEWFVLFWYFLIDAFGSETDLKVEKIKFAVHFTMYLNQTTNCFLQKKVKGKVHRFPKKDTVIRSNRFLKSQDMVHVCEPRHDKTNIMGLQPAWIQTSLRIHAV
jgi:hypothetical protein